MLKKNKKKNESNFWVDAPQIAMSDLPDPTLLTVVVNIAGALLMRIDSRIAAAEKAKKSVKKVVKKK